MNTTNVGKALLTTCDAVKAMMVSDNYDESKKATVLTAINVAVKSTDYIHMIKEQVKKIRADGKFNANDLPYVFSIIINSRAFLVNTVKSGMDITSTIKIDSTKYIVYGVLYFVMVTENVEPDVITQTTDFYPALWDLIAVDPKDFLIKADSCWRKAFPCCFVCGCCPKSTLEERLK